ncbi:MAG TPA: hypothetical protein VFE78_02505 [Gemmataceae bacterium]|nr:hypothetical protein [Gemmataceae bacterium]
MTRAEALKALIDGLRRAPQAGADGRAPGPAAVRAILLFDDPGTLRGAGAARPVGVSGKWEVRARDCRTGEEWRFLLLEAEGGEAVVVLRRRRRAGWPPARVGQWPRAALTRAGTCPLLLFSYRLAIEP